MMANFTAVDRATVRLPIRSTSPQLKRLEFVGIYDDPNTPEKEGMIGMAERLGITSLTRNDYGLSLTLGGGDVSLLDMTSAYSVFANGGQRMPPVAILKITDFAGNIIYEYKPQAGEQVIRAEHAYLISSILSDNEARSFTFGRNSALNLSFPVAAKTGTTNDIRDNWTMGYTPDLVTGVWVGNADYTPMVSSSGLSGAAPIWSQFMEFAVPYLTNGAPTRSLAQQGLWTEQSVLFQAQNHPTRVEAVNTAKFLPLTSLRFRRARISPAASKLTCGLARSIRCLQRSSRGAACFECHRSMGA